MNSNSDITRNESKNRSRLPPACAPIWNTLLDRLSEGVFVADKRDIIMQANAALCQLLGYGRDELSGLHLSDITVKFNSDNPWNLSKFRSLDIGNDIECQIYRNDGTLVPVRLRIFVIETGGTVGLVIPYSSWDALKGPSRLAAIIDCSNDAIVGKDLNGIVTDWNAAAESLFGHTAHEIIGQSITRIIPPDRLHEEDHILDEIRNGRRVEHFETVRQTKEKGLIDVSVTISPIRNASGTIIGASKIARDMTSTKARQHELARMVRLYDALSQINQTIVYTKDRAELFGRVCELLVERGGFKMAWIGFQKPDSSALVPVAVHGDQSHYTEALEIRVDAGPEGRGPSAISFQTQRPYICNDVTSDAATKSWRRQMKAAGYRSSAVFPISEHGVVSGALNVYADQPGFFGEEEVSLLKEAAGDVSFALDQFSREIERQHAERIAREEVELSNAMIESMPGLVCLMDRDGHWLRWNKSLESASGYSAGDIAQMHPGDLFAIADKTSSEQGLLAVLERSAAPTEAELRTKNGKRIPCMLTTAWLEYKGRDCLVCMGFDISRLKDTEAALCKLNKSLERKVAARTRALRTALDRAMAADEVKSVFLATMSHELRTPLNSIIGFTGILLRGLAGELNAEQAKQLRMVQDSGHHLLNLINDVLDISKIEAGQLEIHVQSFDLEELLVRTASSMQPIANKKGLELVVDVAADIGNIESDQRRVEQILINLLTNAIKFTERGTVHLSAERIDDYQPTPNTKPIRAVRLRVTDTGIGIDPDKLDALFEPFRQLDAGLSRQHEGTGLGLTICRRLADLLHGDVAVDSQPRKGSTFTLTLPLNGSIRP